MTAVLDPFTVSSAALGLTGTALGWHWYLSARRAHARADELRAELRTQRHAANHDPLTDLPNRRAFFQIGAALVAEPARRPAAVVLLDLDNFKQINDRHGHATGDHVLATIARRLSGYAQDNLVARLGGDEFAALFTCRATDGVRAYPAVDSLAQLVAEPIRYAGHALAVTASIGLSQVAGDGTLVQALHEADIAMYQAKRCGGMSSMPAADRSPSRE